MHNNRWISTGSDECPICKERIETWAFISDYCQGMYGYHNGYLWTDNNELIRHCSDQQLEDVRRVRDI